MKLPTASKSSRRVALRAVMGLATHVIVVGATAAHAAEHQIDDAALPADQRDRLAALVPAFFGAEYSNYLPVLTPKHRQKVQGKELLADQFLRVFPGVPVPSVRLSTGHVLVGGAQPHNADTKAFVVTQGDAGRIVAAALLHRACGAPLRAGQETSCTPIPILTIFYPASTVPQDDLSRSIVRGVMISIRDINAILRDAPDFQVRQIGVKVRTLD